MSIRSLSSALLAGASLGTLACTGTLAAEAPAPLRTPDEIIISASPLARSAGELAVPVTVLDRDAILGTGGATLGEVLGKQPGVTESSFARGASRPIIRGLDNFRVRVQENGIAAKDVSALSEDHGIPIDPLAAQRIEIIRGPAVLRYGTEAIGGLVSVLNDRIPERRPQGDFAAEAYGAYGSVDDGYEAGGLLDGGAGPFVLHLDAFRRDRGDYAIPRGGEQANTAAEASGVAGGGSLLFGRGFLGASLAYFESEYGIPGVDAAASGLLIDLEQVKVALAGGASDLAGPIARLRVDAGYADYTHDEVEGITGEIGSTFDNQEFEGRVEIVHAPAGPLEGAFGLQYRDRDLEASGEGGELIAPSESEAIAGFLFEEWRLAERARLQLGARVEHASLSGFGVRPPSLDGSMLMTPIDDFGRAEDLDFTPVSVSSALVFDLGGATSLGATLQYVERAPDLLELFAKGPHEASETFEIGSPDLGKESALALDVTLKRTEGRLTFDAAAFYTSFKDFIFKAFTVLVCGDEFETCGIAGNPGVEEELTQIAYGQSDAEFWGFELSGRIEAATIGTGTLALDARADYVRAELESGGNVPRIPPLRVGAGVAFERGGLKARLGVLHVFEQDEVAAEEEATKGYTDLHAEIAHEFALANAAGTIEIGLSGRNLLDEDARNHVSFKKADVLLPGADVRLFIRARF